MSFKGLNLRNVVKIGVASLAVCMMFASCKKESDEKKITAFSFAAPLAAGVIDENAKTIKLTVPEGTNVTALVPAITVSEKATVSPASGVVQNFTTPVSYTVTAENGTTQAYVVTVIVGGTGEDEPDPDKWETLPGTMSENRTIKAGWYIIDGCLYIEGNALVTIEAGVTIRFTGTNGRISVGENAGLAMNGTAEKPIRISGPINNPNKGSWWRIQYNSNRADNVMNYVYLTNGGSGTDNYSAVVELEKGQLKMTNCIIDGSASNGVYGWAGKFTVFENNQIKNCNAAPIYTYDGYHPFEKMNTTTTFSGNTKNYADIRWGDVGDATKLPKINIPWYFADGLYVDPSDNITFTIEAGTKLYFNSDKRFYVGARVKLIAEGTASDRIVFRGLEDEAGFWRGIRFSSTRADNKLNYCDISGSGYLDDYTGNCNLYLDPGSTLQIHNTKIGKSKHYGIGLEGDLSTYTIDHQNVTFESCAKGNVWKYGGTQTWSSLGDVPW